MAVGNGSTGLVCRLGASCQHTADMRPLQVINLTNFFLPEQTQQKVMVNSDSAPHHSQRSLRRKRISPVGVLTPPTLCALSTRNVKRTDTSTAKSMPQF